MIADSRCEPHVQLAATELNYPNDTKYKYDCLDGLVVLKHSGVANGR